MSSTKRGSGQQRGVADPEVHHGEPCIAGTRIPERMIAGSLADGLTVEQILAEYSCRSSAYRSPAVPVGFSS